MSALPAATFDRYYGRGIAGRPNRAVLYADHGNASRWHRPHRLEFHWVRGVLVKVRGRAVCGARLLRPQLADAPPAGLSPCVRCHFHLTVVPTEVA